MLCHDASFAHAIASFNNFRAVSRFFLVHPRPTGFPCWRIDVDAVQQCGELALAHLDARRLRMRRLRDAEGAFVQALIKLAPGAGALLGQPSGDDKPPRLPLNCGLGILQRLIATGPTRAWRILASS